MRKAMNGWAVGLWKSGMVVVVAAVAVAVGIALATCNVHGADDGGGGATTLKTVDVAEPKSDGGGVAEGGTSEADGSGKATLSMTLCWGAGSADGPAQSVVGADGEQIRLGGGVAAQFLSDDSGGRGGARPNLGLRRGGEHG